MAEQVRIWQVDKPDALTEIKRSKLDLEERIEKWIMSDVSLLSSDLLVIGEQVPTASGNFIDLLCIDRSGNLVVVELKRDKTPREVTAQALDYASWVKDLDTEEIEAIAAKHLKDQSLEDAYLAKFGGKYPDVINEHHAMLVVASEIDDSTERIIRYLSETHGVDINAVRFQFFKSGDGREFLVRTFTVAPQEIEQNTKRRGSKRTVPSPLQNLQSEFWSEFVEFCNEERTPLALREPQAGSAYIIGLGRVGMKISLTVKAQRESLGCEIYIDHPRAKEAFDQLEIQKGEIEAELGASLQWQRLEGRGACRIAQFRPADVYVRNNWKEYFTWLKERAETFHQVFSPRVKLLELGESEDDQ
jgi:hypothetical protein